MKNIITSRLYFILLLNFKTGTSSMHCGIIVADANPLFLTAVVRSALLYKQFSVLIECWISSRKIALSGWELLRLLIELIMFSIVQVNPLLVREIRFVEQKECMYIKGKYTQLLFSTLLVIDRILVCHLYR